MRTANFINKNRQPLPFVTFVTAYLRNCSGSLVLSRVTPEFVSTLEGDAVKLPSPYDLGKISGIIRGDYGG
jgi:hypothetical protein